MALAQLPVYVVSLPQVAPPVGSPEVDLPSLHPSEVGANAAVYLTDAAELGVDVVGPSLPIHPRVTTIVVLFQSGFKLFQSLNLVGAGRTMVQTRIMPTPR